jgi:putative hemolysin
MKIFPLLIVTMAVTACASRQPAKPETGMANPASVYCQKQGGKLDSVQTEVGTSSYCTLPNGERMEEWALYRKAVK